MSVYPLSNQAAKYGNNSGRRTPENSKSLVLIKQQRDRTSRQIKGLVEPCRDTAISATTSDMYPLSNKATRRPQVAPRHEARLQETKGLWRMMTRFPRARGSEKRPSAPSSFSSSFSSSRTPQKSPGRNVRMRIHLHVENREILPKASN